VLERTITDLYKLYPYISSIAIVPVGLTKYHKNGLLPVTKEKAEEIIKIVETFQKRFHRKHGVSFVYLADEFYIKAAQNFPALHIYDDFPQIENGVGMVPLFMDKAMTLQIPSMKFKKDLLALQAFRFILIYLNLLKSSRKNIVFDVYP